jgi:quercetin dioxygenase-like cupin family protein
VIVPSLARLAKFDPQKFAAVTLAQTPRSKTMLVCLEPGQAIPVHSPGIDLTLVVLEGEATLVAGEEELNRARAGAAVVVQAGQPRGIRADVRTLALVVVSPPPTEQDQRVVDERLGRGTWR